MLTAVWRKILQPLKFVSEEAKRIELMGISNKKLRMFSTYNKFHGWSEKKLKILTKLIATLE